MVDVVVQGHTSRLFFFHDIFAVSVGGRKEPGISRSRDPSLLTPYPRNITVRFLSSSASSGSTDACQTALLSSRTILDTAGAINPSAPQHSERPSRGGWRAHKNTQPTFDSSQPHFVQSFGAGDGLRAEGARLPHSPGAATSNEARNVCIGGAGRVGAEARPNLWEQRILPQAEASPTPRGERGYNIFHCSPAFCGGRLDGKAT